MRRAWLVPWLVVLAACGDDGAVATTASSSVGSGGGGGSAAASTSTTSQGGAGDGAGGAALEADLASELDESGEGTLTLALSVDGARDVVIDLGADELVLEIEVEHLPDVDVTISTGPPTTSVDVGEPPADIELVAYGHWLRPRPVGAGSATLHFTGVGDVTVTAHARGAPVPAARRERSLVWTDEALLEDPTLVGLAKVLAAASDDGHGGVMLDAWFRRFATTAHSERAAPATLMDDVASLQGDDPHAWDLDALPFRVTGVHNRLDLAPRNGACGELRVSIGSVDPIASPMHILFLFQQAPRADDVRLDGVVHCLGTSRRWARLSSLEGDDFAGAARAWLDAGLTHDAFVLAESVELTVSPWEWRQWKKVAADELDNPPLFQTVATPLLNAPGPLRDDFLAFVAANAASLDARDVLLPASYEARSMQVPPSAPAERLDLTGLDPSVAAAYPDLARSIEIVGCPTCHTEDAEFVQTSIDRVFSPFYDAELDARARRLDRLGAGVVEETPPFGPLQEPVDD